MGAAPAAVVAAVAIAVAASTAAADPCTGRSAAGRFAACFDPGNRLSITAGTDGLGGSIAIRHVVHFDDEPDLVWRLEHVAFEATHATLEDRLTGALYRGHYTRHARDGHIVLPLGVPKKVFLPFDIGSIVEVGTIAWRPGEAARLGLVRTAGLIDLARSRSFRTRLALGPVARWEVAMTRESWTLGDHAVAPFSTGMANLHYESATGRLVGDLRVEAGAAWHAGVGWEPEARAEATLERIVLAINDRPISISLGARYESQTAEAIARIGARIVLFDRRDPRVRLD